MAIRRGVIPVTSQPGNHNNPHAVKTHEVRGRQVTKRADPAPPPQAPREERRILLHGNEQSTAVRGMIVGVDMKPIKGLSKATLEAHHAYAEAATEQCQRCGQMRPPAAMRTVIANAEQPNNPLRICITECMGVAYKNPYDSREAWKPSVPQVRFDRDRGQPYDPRERGMSISDLITKDTYHKESEVDPEMRKMSADRGTWSGQSGRIGHTPKRR